MEHSRSEQVGDGQVWEPGVVGQAAARSIPSRLLGIHTERKSELTELALEELLRILKEISCISNVLKCILKNTGD